ncbi:MAG TPA: 2-aminoethylphosphonate--pyruvate transaminase [Alphaproteobacteria bacterium]
MIRDDDAPILLTPGPLTTSRTVREAMLRDWGSRDPAFIEMNRRVRDRLAALVAAGDTHACVPVQGSGTFAVEAVIGTFVPRDGKLLVLVNGEYGRRIVRIAEILGRAHAVLETDEDTPPSGGEVASALEGDPAITHVALVHCETTSGILNPLGEIAAAVARAGRELIVDAMSSFGILPIDARAHRFVAVAASSNKALEGVPGMGFAIARREALAASAGNAPSLSLDLADQHRAMEGNGQWRFTPPTHVMAALDRALDELEEEGGPEARLARYRANCRALVDGMRALGFRTFLSDNLQTPTIVTFHMPGDPNFAFARFYELMGARGFVIYPGKLTRRDSFRIGCMGRIDADDLRRAVAAVKECLVAMKVRSGAPA